MTKTISETELKRLTKAEEAELDRAQAALKRARASRNGAAALPQLRKIEDIEAKVHRRTVTAQRAADRAETIALAKGRGEEVDEKGRVTRIMTRQGIQQAYEGGHMSSPHGHYTAEHLYEVAKAYRDAFEIAQARISGNKGEGGGGFSAKGPQVRIVEAGEALAIMREGLSAKQRKVLDHVCGLDMRLRETATVLKRGFPSVKRSLVSGLEMVALNLKAHRALKDRGEPSTAERLRDAASQIDQALRSAS